MHNDSSFFPTAAQKFYPGNEQFNGLRVFGISTNGGGAFTLVLWRALFIHMMFVFGPEQQWRSYEYLNRPTKTISYLSFSGDVRGSFGLNFKRAYVVWTSSNDFVWYSSSWLFLRNKSLGGSFAFGWRFNSTTPHFYRKFQNTRLYSNL
jgi:hypothetical protein